MIKNIVFDMGGVLVEFDGQKLGQLFGQEEAAGRKLEREVFGSAEWKLLDKGVITYPEAEERICKRLSAEMVPKCYEALKHWHEHLPVLKKTNDLAFDLKKAGYRLYLCSNASLRFYEYHETIPALKIFDGILISAEEQCLKPEAEIYHRLYQKFNLVPAECFFLDDLAENIAGGQATGMDGLCFTVDRIEEIRGRFLS